MATAKSIKEQDVSKTCGVIMPISAMDRYTKEHWEDVYNIISEASIAAEFEPKMVSFADEIGVIQKAIVQNLYNNEIVVCDISGKNPNVMFELGLRLAFDKPTVIIKDEETSYPFDTSIIEHITYPTGLDYYQIRAFIKKLTDRIQKTFEKSQRDENYSTFIKHFGDFIVPKLEQKEVTGQEYLLEEMTAIKQLIYNLDKTARSSKTSRSENLLRSIVYTITPIPIKVKNLSQEETQLYRKYIRNLKDVEDVDYRIVDDAVVFLVYYNEKKADVPLLKEHLKKLFETKIASFE